MRNIGTVCLGCTAALLLTAPLRAEEPAKGDSTGTRLAQSDRPRGFFGFPDWDSRSGGYDRSRRAEADEKPRDGTLTAAKQLRCRFLFSPVHIQECFRAADRLVPDLDASATALEKPFRAR